MKTLIKSAILAAGIALSGAGLEAAAETLDVNFTYDPAASAEDIYRSARKTAREACDIKDSRATGVLLSERLCRIDLLGSFVEALGRADVAQEHYETTGRRIASQTAVLAED